MAIIEGSSGQSNSGAAPNTPPPQDKQGSLDDIFRDLGIQTLSGSVDLEAFNTFSDEMKKRAKEAQSFGIKIDVVPVTAQQLKLPVLALSAEYKGAVVVFSLLIEGMMSEPLQPDIEQIRPLPGQPAREIIVDIPTARCYDTTLRNVVQSTVANQLGVVTDRVKHMSYCVVPRTAKLTDPEVCRLFFDSANLALTTTLAGKQIKTITSRHLSDDRAMINQTITLTPGQNKISRTGIPLAADWTTRLELVKRGDNLKNSERFYEVHKQQVAYNLAEVSGYIDFAPTESQPIAGMNQMAPPTKPGFMPINVVTDIIGLANNGRSMENVSTILLGLVATTAIIEDGAWKRVFEAPPGSKSQKTSIGYLGVEHDPFIGRAPKLGLVKVESVGYQKTQAEGVLTPKQVGDLWCTDKVISAMDVEEGGRLQWVHSLFTMAAGVGVDESKRNLANQTIVEECDKLTNNVFSKKWADYNQGVIGKIVSKDIVTVHLGTYRGEDGSLRDIRSIDYLTALSVSSTDLEAVANATAATIPGLSNSATLSDRRAFLKSVTGGMEITGMATRLFFNPGFIRVMVASMIDAGITFRNEMPLGYGRTGQRVVINYNLGDTVNGAELYSRKDSSGGMGAVTRGGFQNNLWFD